MSTNVELRHLRALAAIGDEGTITDAAIAVGISQPALSRTLEQLESLLGTRLVERTTRTLALTEPGQRLCQDAHRLLRQLDIALDAAKATKQPALRLGFAWAALGERTVPFLHTWREAHPETEIEIHRVNDPEAELRRGTLDLAITRTEPAPGSGLLAQPLFREARVAAVAAGSELGHQEATTLAQLADHPVVLCSTAATTTPELWADTAGLRTFEVSNTDEWLTTIALDDAIGVTAASTQQDHPHPGVRYLPITDAEDITVNLLGPQEPTHPASTLLVAHARRFLS